jgi:hypothetical protein
MNGKSEAASSLYCVNAPGEASFIVSHAIYRFSTGMYACG